MRRKTYCAIKMQR